MDLNVLSLQSVHSVYQYFQVIKIYTTQCQKRTGLTKHHTAFKGNHIGFTLLENLPKAKSEVHRQSLKPLKRGRFV